MFDTFWQMYPRKVSKKAAHKSWSRMSQQDQALALQAIPQHIAYWQALGTELQYIPHASTWLNQERFHDELEMPKPKAEILAGWWNSDQGTLEMGRRVGLNPGNGESWASFRERIRARMAA